MLAFTGGDSWLGRLRGVSRVFLLSLCVTAVSGCAGCEPPKVTCEDEGTCPPPPIPCNDTPKIVRTTFDPKEGRVPFDVTFNVKAEDADTIVCEETLLYHFDFDSDGVADYKSPKGRATHRITVAGKHDVTIWVTDSANHVSKKVSKFVLAEDNQPPYISSVSSLPAGVGIVGGPPFLFDWYAFDPDGGALVAIRIDFGDGTPIEELGGAISATAHAFTKAGQYTVRITAVDADGATFTRGLPISIVIATRPSSLFQTVGNSQALALNDNEGQYWTDADGPFLYGYLADGAIALKTLKYPLSAFDAVNPQGMAQLVGWADPGNVTDERWDDVVTYQNLAVVSGSRGFQVFSVNADPTKRTCTQADYEESKARFDANNFAVSQNCWPGTPQKPVVVCGITGNGLTLGITVRDIQLLYPSAKPTEVWAIGNTRRNTSTEGGFLALRLDLLTTGEFYYDPRCPGGWFHKGWTTHSAYNKLSADTEGMVVHGDFAYLGVFGAGFRVVNAGRYMSEYLTGGPPENEFNVFSLDVVAPYDGPTQTSGAGVAVAKSRPVSESLYPEDFLGGFAHVDKYGGLGQYGDCSEEKTVLSAITSPTEAVIRVQGGLILPGNRVALQTLNFDDRSGGAGYLVTGNNAVNGEIVISYATAPTAPVGDWQSVYPVPVSFAVLPAYPGKNTVVFSGTQSGSLARNNVCRTFINAYAPITEPVGVQFQAAPLVFVSLDTSLPMLGDGILIADISATSGVPELLNFAGWTARSKSSAMTAHENYLYVSGGSLGNVEIVDISDPYHVDPNKFKTGTHCSQCPSGTFIDYAINRMEYVTTPTNPKGVLLIPGGPVGMNALSVADALATPDTFNSVCPVNTGGHLCMSKVPGLQLRHEGTINDIQLIGNQHALVSQKRGGVLVFDTSAIPYGGSVTFVSHVRTEGDPRAMRVVTDAAGAPQTLWIADNTSYYKVAFTDPANPGVSIRGGLVAGRANYDCIEYTDGRVFLCYSEPNPSQPGLRRGVAMYANGNTIPNILMRFGENAPSDPKDQCSPTASSLNGLVDAGFTGLSTAVLNGRFMLFMETGPYGNTMRELKTDGNGNIIVNAGVSDGCHWAVSLYGKFLSYQDRKGANPWKRLYTSSTGGLVTAYNIGGFEEEIAEPGFETAIGPDVLGSRDLNLLGNKINVRRIVALGPYVFVAGFEVGAYVIDASVVQNMQVIGRTSVSVGQGIIANTLNAMAYPEGDPNNPATTYTYVMLVSDMSAAGGIRLIEFPNLERP